MRSLPLSFAVAAAAALATPAIASASYPGAVLADGPQAYYRMSEPAGATTLADATTNHRDATLTNGTLGVTGPVLDVGNVAVSLDHTSSIATPAIGSAVQSLEVWIKPSARTPQTIASQGDDQSSGWSVKIAPSGGSGLPKGAKRKLIFTSAGQIFNSRVPLSTGIWTMLDVVQDPTAGMVHFYVNGSGVHKDVRPPSPATFTWPSNTGAVQVGPAGNAGTSAYDELALYAATLTPEQVQAHFAASPLPDDVTAPTLSPTTGVKAGDTLRFRQGSWLAATTVADVWQRCNDTLGVCSTIDAATAASAYTLQDLDVGYTIQVQETATNAFGSVVVYSDVTDPVLAADGSTPPDPGGTTPPAGDNNNPPVDETPPSGGTSGGTTTGGGTTKGGGTTTGGGTPGSTPSGSTSGGSLAVVATSTSCRATLLPAKARVAKIAAVGRIRISLNALTGRLQVKAPRGKVRSVSFTLDGKRLKAGKRSPWKAVVRAIALKGGKHVIKARVTPRHGKSRVITLRFSVKGC
jgi:hypothetical protein